MLTWGHGDQARGNTTWPRAPIRRATPISTAANCASLLPRCLHQHFTLKQNPLRREDLDDFVACYNADSRHERRETWSEENPDGQWRSYSYDELGKRDKLNLEIFWIKDESLSESENLPEPDVLAQEIAEDLQAALGQFSEIVNGLGEE